MDYINEQKEIITYKKLKQLYQASEEARRKTGQGLNYWHLLYLFGNELWRFTEKENDKIIDEQDNLISIEKYPNLNLESNIKKILIQALEKSNWVQKEAAKLLKISNHQINCLIVKYNIKHKNWKTNK